MAKNTMTTIETSIISGIRLPFSIECLEIKGGAE